MLAGALVALVSFFLPAFAPWSGSPSQWDLLRRAGGIIWPDALAIVLLVGGASLALASRNGAYLGSLAGALVGLSFLVSLQAPFLLVPGGQFSISLQGRPTG